jgi:hypothetical protein
VLPVDLTVAVADIDLWFIARSLILVYDSKYLTNRPSLPGVDTLDAMLQSSILVPINPAIIKSLNMFQKVGIYSMHFIAARTASQSHTLEQQ